MGVPNLGQRSKNRSQRPVRCGDSAVTATSPRPASRIATLAGGSGRTCALADRAAWRSQSRSPVRPHRLDAPPPRPRLIATLTSDQTRLAHARCRSTVFAIRTQPSQHPRPADARRADAVLATAGEICNDSTQRLRGSARRLGSLSSATAESPARETISVRATPRTCWRTGRPAFEAHRQQRTARRRQSHGRASRVPAKRRARRAVIVLTAQAIERSDRIASDRGPQSTALASHRAYMPAGGVYIAPSCARRRERAHRPLRGLRTPRLMP